MKICRMRIFATALIVLMANSAFADEPDCVRVYREAHAEYYNKMEDNLSLQHNTNTGSVIGGLAWGLCAGFTKMYGPCSALFGVGIVAAQGYRLDLEARLEKMQSAHQIYDVYFAIHNEDYKAEEVQTLFIDLRVPTHLETAAVQEYRRLMESGELCKDGAPAKSYTEVLGLVRDRLDQY